VSERDAFQEEMAFDDQSLREFALATRAALVAVPDPAIGRNLVPELAAAAATGHRDEVLTTATRPAGAPRRSRRALVARIAFAVALVPALFAGLAVAGVNVPRPAQDAFEAVGVDLPNQEGSDEGGGGESSEPTQTRELVPPGEGTEGNGQDKSNPVRIDGRGNGAQGNGRALGKRGIPPGNSGSHSNNGNAGGNGKGKAVGKNDGTPPGQAKPKPVHPPKLPRPVVPPGQAKKGAQQDAGVGNGGNGGGNGQGR
jgi:hypothetical protein